MNTTNFEYLLAIEETGSISRAAEKFFVSPSAVSQCLKQEESQLGYPIFQNENRRKLPTEAGAIYLRGAREILAIRKKTYAQIQQTIHSSQLIRIAVPPLLREAAFHVLKPQLAECFPDMGFRFLCADSRAGMAYLLHDLADFAFLTLPAFHHPRLDGKPLGSYELRLLIPKAYLRGRLHHQPTLADCSSIPFILLKEGTCMREYENAVLERAPVSLSRIYEAESFLTVRAFLEDGKGAAFLPDFLLPRQAERHFHLLPVQASTPLSFYLAWPSQKEAKAISAAICQAWPLTGFPAFSALGL